VRVGFAIVALCFVHPVSADDESTNFTDLMRQGYSIAAAEQLNEPGEFLVFLQRGVEAFVCTPGFKQSGADHVSGPWNRYRECSRISGAADFVYDPASQTLEPAR
jgi:hypothetical protein